MELGDRALLTILVSIFLILQIAGVVDGESRCPPWCVAKPDAADDVIQAGLNWACKNGADCGPITPLGPCHANGDLKTLASYAFNDYFQKVRSSGGQCTFGDGIGYDASTLTNTNPSYGGCQFTCAPY